MSDFDHLTDEDIVEHIVRLHKRLQQPSGIAYTLEEIGADNREMQALSAELHRRQQA